MKHFTKGSLHCRLTMVWLLSAQDAHMFVPSKGNGGKSLFSKINCSATSCARRFICVTICCGGLGVLNYIIRLLKIHLCNVPHQQFLVYLCLLPSKLFSTKATENNLLRTAKDEDFNLHRYSGIFMLKVTHDFLLKGNCCPLFSKKCIQLLPY